MSALPRRAGWVGTAGTAGVLALALAGCGGTGTSSAPPVIDIALIGFNDFHGNLEPPKQSIRVQDASGTSTALPAGGVAGTFGC